MAIPAVCPLSPSPRGPVPPTPHKGVSPEFVLVSGGEVYGELVLDLLIRHLLAGAGVDLVQRLPALLRRADVLRRLDGAQHPAGPDAQLLDLLSSTRRPGGRR